MFAKLFASFLFYLFLDTSQAYAYLDPGTGTMIVQAIVGGIAAASAAAGLYWSKIKSFFDKGKDNEQDNDLSETKE